ncbi:family 43 glycosylhydrolase [Plantibacter sp. CFBP 8798]|uniref:family 43 glycosylhydrolase n=1 Tax=Plantibacter sp. CFBP 8798 TaxID=2775268 RepID=UPI001786AFBE|nr:family 43 glycosylhydrolase [Plantibacter sp. CFBP 8798]MBD8467453.1 family 43 glycosylhydrolase [Plantibacter sp. CFBP 8798]
MRRATRRPDRSTPDGGAAVLRRGGLAAGLLAVAIVGTTTLTAGSAAAAEAPAAALLSWGDPAAPAELVGTPVTGVAAGLGHAVALGADGTVLAWGADGFGQSTVPSLTGTITQVAAGTNHSLALAADGTVTAWGRDADGQATVPAGLDRVLRIAAGGPNSAAVRADGTLALWGDDAFGQNDLPTALDGTRVTGVAIGSGFTVALTDDGDVVPWGRSDAGQLELPTALADEDVVQLAAGTDHTLALAADGTVLAWGADGSGQTEVPASLDGVDVVRVFAGPYLSGAIAADGSVTVWGAADARAALPDGLLAAGVALGETGAVAAAGAVPVAGGTNGGLGNTVDSLPGGTDPGTGPGGEPGADPGLGQPGSGTNAAGAGGLAVSGVSIAAAVIVAAVLLLAGALLILRRRRVVASSAAEDASSSGGVGRSGVAGAVVLALGLSGALVTADAPRAEAAPSYPSPTVDELVANDFVLYFANAGSTVTDAVSAGDHIGLYQSRTDQSYGVDAATGASWGFVADANSNPTANSSSGTEKTASLRYDAPPAGSSLPTRSVDYAFDLPAGKYEVTLGFNLPSGWAARPLDLKAEGETLAQVTAPAGALLEQQLTVSVDDGTLDLEVHSPAGRTNTYTDPAVNYLVIRAPHTASTEVLAAKIRAVTLDEGQRAGYVADSLAVLDAAIADAQALVDAGSTDTAALTAAYDVLGAARTALRPIVTYDSFRPGQAWVDDQGNPIQAHGGQVVPSTDADGQPIYYWYGEDRWNGYASSRGVHVYSSRDLYNWTDEGLALQALSTVDQLTTDPAAAELYADYTARQRAAVVRDLLTVPSDPVVPAAILERPKVMYNAATEQWVMWIHTDGPSATSDAQYAKATAGVAVSDSPTGPFRYVDSYRLNVAPEGEPNYQPDSPGMARDMNLFTDVDGTGYIIYASEENLTLFISKLSSNFMFLSAPVDRAVKGEDFTRTYIGGQREAPAVFVYDGTYYLITSGATGWNPNPAKYATADSMLGEWTDHGNPVSGSGASTTHGSQSTSVIPIDAAAGKFIYMGDRWTPSDLRNAPAVWLPLEFGDDGSLSLKWYDEWTLADLEGKGKVAVDVDVPTTVRLGDASTLPSEAQVTEGGTTTTRTITWDTAALAVPGPVSLTGAVEGVSRPVTRQVTAVPKDLVYLVDAGGSASPEYDAIRSVADADGTLLNSTSDRTLGADAATGANWGVVGAETGTTDGPFSESLRYVASSATDRTLEYAFDSLDAGSYDVYVGLYDPWSQWADNRRADIGANGATLLSAQPITGTPTVATLSSVQPDAGGRLSITLDPVGSGGGTDVQLSWIMIVRR